MMGWQVSQQGKKISGVDLQSAGMDVYYDYNTKDYKF
jgi:hypothetical protein